MKLHPSVIIPVIVGATTLFWSWSQAQEIPETLEPVVASTNAFAPVTKALAENDLTEAAALLKTMKADGLKPDQFSRWENLAARTAVRLGDAQWLKELNSDAELSRSADEVVTIAAMRLLFANRLAETRTTLEGIKHPYQMSEIPKRRYEELYLKLEQLSGNKKEEQKWAGKLVDFVADWDSPTCQSCHANPKVSGKDITHFDLNNWWVGKRFSQLVKESGDAEKIEKEARAALLKDGKDTGATIRLSYALRAQNKTEESEKTLRKVEWGQWADKPFKKPLRLGVFP